MLSEAIQYVRPDGRLTPEGIRALSGVGGTSSGAWGTITGVLADQADLDAALDAKADDGHTHIIADVTGLQAALDGKQTAGSYAAAVHTHAIADVTGLTAALAGKADTAHTHVAADVTNLAATVQGYTLNLFAAPVAAVNFNQQQAQGLALENRTSDPGSPVTGQIWLRTDL